MHELRRCEIPSELVQPGPGRGKDDPLARLGGERQASAAGRSARPAVAMERITSTASADRIADPAGSPNLLLNVSQLG
jgi:hypothetical protein